MRPAPMTAALVALLAAASPPTATAAVAEQPDVLSSAHTAGRVETAGDAVRYSWPGVYFEGRFQGTGIGIVLDDAVNDYAVDIDGMTRAPIVTPGKTTRWITGLNEGNHTVRLAKRSESAWTFGEFRGFIPVKGGKILPKPPARHRQIEFIGDSYTAGYGNRSKTRSCSAYEITRTTDANLSFGALTARRLNADYQINAYSGRGLVRNFSGTDPDADYRTFYHRALLNRKESSWQNAANWRPQLVVIGLGFNDFSTPVKPGERWTPQSLADSYRAAYHGFIDELRASYGSETIIVVSATLLYSTTAFIESTQRIVRERNQLGDDRVRYWYYDSPDRDYAGCDLHPSVHDHRLFADQLEAFVSTLPIRW